MTEQHRGGGPVRDVVRAFRQAWVGSDNAATANPELLPVRLARACATVLDTDGAGLSLHHTDFRVPIGASDEVATLAERLQFTQGDGPCLHAAANRQMQVADAINLENIWPAYAEQLFQYTPYRAVVSLPLAITPRVFGALDLYLVDPAALQRLNFGEVVELSGAVTGALALALETTLKHPAREQMPGLDDPAVPVWLSAAPAHARTYVWVAMGMAMTKFHLSAADAVALLRSYAYGHDTLLDDLAAELVKGSISLTDVHP